MTGKSKSSAVFVKEGGKRRQQRNWHEKLIQFIKVKSLLAERKWVRRKERNCVITFYKANIFSFFFSRKKSFWKVFLDVRKMIVQGWRLRGCRKLETKGLRGFFYIFHDLNLITTWTYSCLHPWQRILKHRQKSLQETCHFEGENCLIYLFEPSLSASLFHIFMFTFAFVLKSGVIHFDKLNRRARRGIKMKKEVREMKNG